MDNDNELTIHLDSLRGDIDADALIEIMKGTVAILKELNREVSEHGTSNVAWGFSDAGMNSPFRATLHGAGVDALDTIRAFVLGFASLAGSDSPPPHWTPQALKVANSMSRAYAAGISQIEFSGQQQRVRASHDTAKNAAQAIRRLELEASKRSGKYTDYGSVEGNLRGLASLADDDKIVIVDSLSKEAISCYFHDKGIEEQARLAWKRRVTAYGEITHDRSTGQRLSMRVMELIQMRERSQLPQMDDLLGIDISGEMEPSQYVGALRDAY